MLAVGLLVRGALRGISFAAFAGDVVAAILLCLAVLIGYWAYALYHLRYVVDEDLVVVWGATRQVIPVGQIERIVLGRKFGNPRMDGISWPGCCVGRGHVESIGEVLFYSAHRSPAELVYVSTPQATFGLSLADARGLARTVQAAQEQERGEPGRVMALHGTFPGQALLMDRRAVLLAGAALIVFLVAAGYIASRYLALPLTLPLPYPPAEGPQRVGQRSELLRLPATALVWLIAGLVIAAWSHTRLRGVSYSVLVGTLFAECLYAIAAFAAAH